MWRILRVFLCWLGFHRVDIWVWRKNKDMAEGTCKYCWKVFTKIDLGDMIINANMSKEEFAELSKRWNELIRLRQETGNIKVHPE